MMNSSSTANDERQVVAEAEYALAEAHLRLDLETFERLLHRDYVNVQPGGELESRAELLASLRSGSRHWELARADQLDVRLYGETAVVIGRWRSAGRHGAERFDYAARFLSVWVKENGRWQNVAYQAMEIDEENETK